MICDCLKFRRDLLSLSKDILVKGDRMPQWKVFELFCTKYKMQRSQRSFPYSNRFCSQQICSFLVSKLTELIRRDVTLSTLLVDLLSIFYFEAFCARRHVQRLLHTSFSRDCEAIRIVGALSKCSTSNFMKLLLNFGFLSSLPVDSPRLMEQLEHEFATFIFSVAGFTPNIAAYSVREKAMELLAKSNFYHIKGRENYKRMFLVTMALRGVQMSLIRNDNSLIDQFIDCLRMYFSATQDALISVFEVRSILYASFLVINRLDLFDTCCQEFDKIMPECPAVMEPRSLTHLAHCRIRQNLKNSNLPLPSAINKLHLPNSLKSFLLGEVLDISRNRGNVSSQKCVTLSQLKLMIHR